MLDQFDYLDEVNCIKWANRGLHFISGSKDDTAIVWHGESKEWQTFRWRMNCHLERARIITANALKLQVTMAIWSQDDRHVITLQTDFSIKLWDSGKGNYLVRISTEIYDTLQLYSLFIYQVFYYTNSSDTENWYLF